jgi:peptidoglycan/LPS O-acetylase OafA/YrhL
LDHLDGIRGVAILCVLALHWFSWYSPLFHGGSVGVDVFFVLSGFIIITLLWRAAPAWGAFLRRRALRLYPALIGLVGGSLVLTAVVPWAPWTPGEVGDRGLLVLAQGSSIWAAGQHGSFWLPGLQPFGQTWSLAVEWYFYLLWPALVLLARRRRWSVAGFTRGCLAAAAGCYLVALPLPAAWFYFGPLSRVAELLVGAALIGLLDAPPRRGLQSWLPPAALAALAAYALLGPDGHSVLYRLVGVPVAVAAAVVLIRSGYAGGGGLVSRFLTHRWLTGLGRVSYSLYLWHIVPFLLLADAPGRVPKVALGVIAVAAAAALTALSYLLLERPFLRPRADLLRPRTPSSSSRPTRSSATVRE